MLTGVGVALGVLAAGIIPRWVVAAVAAAIGGAAIGFAVFGWPEAVGGAAGGLTGGYGATPIVTGALRRGGTRGGLALLGRARGARARRRSPSCRWSASSRPWRCPGSR